MNVITGTLAEHAMTVVTVAAIATSKPQPKCKAKSVGMSSVSFFARTPNIMTEVRRLKPVGEKETFSTSYYGFMIYGSFVEMLRVFGNCANTI